MERQGEGMNSLLTGRLECSLTLSRGLLPPTSSLRLDPEWQHAVHLNVHMNMHTRTQFCRPTGDGHQQHRGQQWHALRA